MSRFRLSRSRHDAVLPSNSAQATRAAEAQPTAPHAGDTLFEIGVIIVLHLAFALAVVLTLDAFGVR